MKDTFMQQGLEPAPSTPKVFGEFIRSEIADNIKLVGVAGIPGRVIQVGKAITMARDSRMYIDLRK